jgi:tetratricopeptide (TPR) repeat protein
MDKRADKPAPAVSASLVPSNIPDTVLPYGQPPVKLVEIETSTAGVSRDLRERIRALADNANRIRYRSPLDAAVCWNEAGRLLDQRAGRTAEAWVCHSRALAIFPDHKPSLAALRRLARRARSIDTLSLLLEANIDRSSNPVEKAALWTELAVIELKRKDMGAAMDALREAVRAWPEAVVPHLLKIGVAAREKDDEELTESLDVLAGRWPKSDFSRDLPLTLALIDERLGRLDAGLKRLDKGAIESGLSMAGQWARLRLCLRLNRHEEAVSTIDEILENIESGVMRSALKRLRAVVNCLASDHPADDGPPEAESDDPIWIIELLKAAKMEEHAREANAAREIRAKVRSAPLKEALAVSEVLSRWKSGEKTDRMDASINPDGAIGQAVASFIGLDLFKETERAEATGETESTGARLNDAMAAGDWDAVVRDMSALRERANEERDRWALAVGESAILIHHLGRPDDALAMLRSETDRLNRAPLPALIRAYDSSHESLSELAISEAEDSGDDEFKAWRFGWAALHMESVDRNEAGRLYLRSVELKPDLPFSLAGIGRSVSERSVLAEAYLNAAEVAKDVNDRIQYLLIAGMHYVAQGSGSRAAELLGEALDLDPNDWILRNAVVRLTLTHMETALGDYVEPASDIDGARITDLFALGTLALGVDPQAASQWFKKALVKKPGDPIAEVGFREALLKTRRAAPVAEELRSGLSQAGSPISKALIHQKLAHIHRWWEDDSAASALSLESLDEALPGHRSTLTQLIKHYLVNRQKDEFYRIFTSLFKTVGDDEDAGAIASAAWRMQQSDKAVLRFAVEKNPSSLLELAELESLAENSEERKRLLERLVELQGESAIYLSRLAQALGETGDQNRAQELHKRALEIEPGSLFDLFALASHQRVRKKYSEIVDTLSRLADEMTALEHKVEYLLEAIDIARSELNDNRRAVRLCLDVLKISPQNAYAYIAAREILGFRGGDQVIAAVERPRLDDRGMIIELINTRLGSAGDPGEQRQLNLEMARVLLDGTDTDERDLAKKHIEKALALFPDDLTTHRWIADVHREDGEWTEAIEHLMSAARMVEKPEVGMEIFYAMGELYMDHTEKNDFAEKSFLKVLSWDRSHIASLERISDLYLRMGNFNRASKALEHLVRLIEDPSKKVEKMVSLARVLDQNLNRSKDAEKLLIEARRVDPFAFEPVEVLADLYRRQGDPLSLNIHLDGALTALAAGLIDKPDQKNIYHNIWKILAMKGDEGLAGIAVEAMKIVGVLHEDLPKNAKETRWEIGARVGDPAYNEYICTKAVPAGLRETIKAVEEPLARLLNVSAKQVGVDKSARLHRNNKLNGVLDDMASGFGVEAPAAFTSKESVIRIAPGMPAAIVLPESVANTEDVEVHRYVACYCLQMIHMGLCLATVVSPDRFRRLLAGVIRLSIKDHVPQGMAFSEVEPYYKKVQNLISGRTIDQIRPFAFDCIDPLGRDSLVAELLGIGVRSGFLGAGSLSGAVKAMRMIVGRPEAPLSRLPGAGSLLAYVFSKDHIELRVRMGI